jgi:hypothetical protein
MKPSGLNPQDKTDLVVTQLCFVMFAIASFFMPRIYYLYS